MRIAGGAHTQSRPVTAIGSRVQLAVRSPPQTISPIPRFFGSSHSLDYANHWRSPHAEPPSHNDRKSAKIHPRSVCTSTPTAIPYGQTQIFIRPGVGTAREAPIQNRHFDTVGKRSDSKISSPRAQIPLRERGRGLPMRSHTDTPSIKHMGARTSPI
ncbi:hypothetical protein Taro_014735 [Colocasia esculenta]|uniref:Uncharacterized protein n=1 Tax=Colocasia esculenta TaxID=4460 RepID=A0A843UJJ8_COLES|nr:hypothetical protein [Colocasia esculenta]